MIYLGTIGIARRKVGNHLRKRYYHAVTLVTPVMPVMPVMPVITLKFKHFFSTNVNFVISANAGFKASSMMASASQKREQYFYHHAVCSELQCMG